MDTSLKTVLEEACRACIKLVANGFVISPYLASNFEICKNAIMANKGLKGVFTFNGKLLSAGDTCSNNKLAETLQAISDFGPSAIYNGTIGKRLAADVQVAGGILSFIDMQDYRVEVTDPISVEVMGYTILGMPLPSSGAAGLILVNSYFHIPHIYQQYLFPQLHGSSVSHPLHLHIKN